MSGQTGQGGILLFNTYLLMSGSRHGGQIKRAMPFGVQLQLSAGLVQEEHRGIPAGPVPAVNPSAVCLRPIIYPMTKIATASITQIVGVNFTGIVVAI